MLSDYAAVQDILIIEDNDDDFEATERALSKNTTLANPIQRCRDGLEAWAYLRGEEPFSGLNLRALPGLILLDLNMPGLDGLKLLKRIKGQDDLKKIPVVVMTTSSEQEDVEGCYRAGANTYVQKPVSWTEFTEAMTRLQEYWFQFALLPKER